MLSSLHHSLLGQSQTFPLHGNISWGSIRHAIPGCCLHYIKLVFVDTLGRYFCALAVGRFACCWWTHWDAIFAHLQSDALLLSSAVRSRAWFHRPGEAGPCWHCSLTCLCPQPHLCLVQDRIEPPAWHWFRMPPLVWGCLQPTTVPK
jgi:hypothetical protein